MAGGCNCANSRNVGLRHEYPRGSDCYAASDSNPYFNLYADSDPAHSNSPAYRYKYSYLYPDSSSNRYPAAHRDRSANRYTGAGDEYTGPSDGPTPSYQHACSNRDAGAGSQLGDRHSHKSSRPGHALWRL